MFDASKGQARIADAIDEASDDFAAKFHLLTPAEKLAFLTRNNAVLDSPDAFKDFCANSASPSGGSQMALESVNNSDPNSVISGIMQAASVLPSGVQNAVKRIVNPSDPGHIRVDETGLPQVVTSTAEERDRLQRELDETKDPRKHGSLANQLQDATAQLTARPTADDVQKKAAAWDASESHLVKVFGPEPRYGKVMNGSALVKADDFEKAREVINKAVEDVKK